MAVIESAVHKSFPAPCVQVAPKWDSMNISPVPRFYGYTINTITGTIAAALAANSCIFAMRFSPTAYKGSTALKAYITKVTLTWTTIVAFTTPGAGARRLGFFRGAGAAASGGTAITFNAKKTASAPESFFQPFRSGDMRVATTGALTVTGITFENSVYGIPVGDIGSAGNSRTFVYNLNNAYTAPLVLRPGELFAIRNISTMDAAGTWQAAIGVEWMEES